MIKNIISVVMMTKEEKNLITEMKNNYSDLTVQRWCKVLHFPGVMEGQRANRYVVIRNTIELFYSNVKEEWRTLRGQTYCELPRVTEAGCTNLMSLCNLVCSFLSSITRNFIFALLVLSTVLPLFNWLMNASRVSSSEPVLWSEQ